MRLIKMFGLAVIAAIVAMALVGASSAMAGDTALCKVHEEACAEANRVKTLHMELTEPAKLLTSAGTVLCLKSLVKAHVENATWLATAPAKLGVKVLELTWGECGMNAAHNNCEVVNLEELPLFDVLRTALNLGEATALALNQAHIRVLVNCPNLFFHCIYGSGEVSGFHVLGALLEAGTGHGMFTANELSVPVLSGFFCPATSKWDALYETLEHVYVTK